VATKIILTHEVSGLGAPGDIVEVKDGYARNYLFPRGLATAWTKGAAKQVEAIKRARKAREIATLEDAREVRDRLQEAPVVVPAKAGASGRLFGAVTTADIAEAVAAAGGPKLDSRKIVIAQPIKSLGDHHVQVLLHEDVTAQIDVRVVPQA